LFSQCLCASVVNELQYLGFFCSGFAGLGL
jgi:hypothetical protein